jgi:hypothetical protein
VRDAACARARVRVRGREGGRDQQCRAERGVGPKGRAGASSTAAPACVPAGWTVRYLRRVTQEESACQRRQPPSEPLGRLSSPVSQLSEPRCPRHPKSVLRTLHLAGRLLQQASLRRVWSAVCCVSAQETKQQPGAHRAGKLGPSTGPARTASAAGANATSARKAAAFMACVECAVCYHGTASATGRGLELSSFWLLSGTNCTPPPWNTCLPDEPLPCACHCHIMTPSLWTKPGPATAQPWLLLVLRPRAARTASLQFHTRSPLPPDDAHPRVQRLISETRGQR